MDLQNIFLPIAPELALVEGELRRQIAQVIAEQKIGSELHQVAGRALSHIFAVSGKHLRPALVLYSARLIDRPDWGPESPLVGLATAVELLHSASLIHDDIIDEAVERRGCQPLNKQYSNQVAVLVGDIIYSLVFSLLTELPALSAEQKMEIFRIFCRTTRQMCFGEIYEQQVILGSYEPDLSDYLNILSNKTAVLMSDCCLSSAVACGAEPAQARALAEFGLNFGLAYQLIDDYLDGDALLRTSLDLYAKAEEYVNLAIGSLENLEKIESREKLIELCGFVLQRAQDRQTEAAAD